MADEPATTATNFPAMGYADAPRAVRWLQDVFGFAAKAVHQGEDGTSPMPSSGTATAS